MWFFSVYVSIPLVGDSLAVIQGVGVGWAYMLTRL
jgi:hypothetical protein